MSRQRKILFILLTVAIVVLAVAGFLVVSLDRQMIREKLENRISASLGLPTRMQGNVELHFLPPGASLTNIAIGEEKHELLTAKRVRAGVALLPLLRKEVQLSSLLLEEPVLSLRRGKDGDWAFKVPEQEEPGRFAVDSVLVRDGTLHYFDAADEKKIELEGLDLELAELRWTGSGSFSFSGDLRFDRLVLGRVEVRDLDGAVTAEEGICRIEPLRFGLFGSEAKGWFEVEAGKASSAWKGELIVGELLLGELFQTLAGRSLFEGKVELRADLSGKGPGSILDTLDGTVRITGNDLIQHGFDLDKFIKRFRASRDIDLVDIGVYAFAGPMGALSSKGVDMGRMVWAAGRKDRQIIEELVFNWTLKDGLATAEDVAFRTRENRLAIKGSVDLSGGRYDGLTLGLLNAKGCAELTERISGPFSDPSVEKASMLATLANSLFGVLRKGWEILDFRDCRTFYEGAVTHPEGGKKSRILPWSD